MAVVAERKETTVYPESKKAVKMRLVRSADQDGSNKTRQTKKPKVKNLLNEFYHITRSSSRILT